MKKLSLKSTILFVASISLFASVVPATTASANYWQNKYASGWYKVRVKKTTKVDKIKLGKAAYLNKLAGTKTLHRGAIVKIGYLGRDGFD